MRDFFSARGNTWLHSLDPRTKILWLLLVFATGFMLLDNILALLGLLLYVLILAWLARVMRQQLSMMKVVLPLFAMVMLFNIFLWPTVKGVEQRVLIQLPFKYPWYYLAPQHFSPSPVVITREGLYMGMTRGMVLLTLSGAASLFILLIEVTELIEGLTLMKIPHSLALTCGLAIVYIPILFRDLSTIAEAQRARGYRLDQGGTLSRLKASTSLLLPAINCAYVRASHIADSMNSRAFGVKAKRTLLTVREMKGRDWGFLALNAALFVAGILVNRFAGMGIFVRF